VPASSARPGEGRPTGRTSPPVSTLRVTGSTKLYIFCLTDTKSRPTVGTGMEVAYSSTVGTAGRGTLGRFACAGRARDALMAQLESLQAAAAEIGHLRVAERLAAVAHATARDGLGASLLVLAVAEDRGRHLRAVGATGLPGDPADRFASIRLDEPGPIARLAREREPVLFDADPGAMPGPGAASRPRLGTRALAALPLWASDRPLGLMVLERTPHHPFTADDRPFLNVLAGLCALALERLRLSEERSDDRAILRRRVALHAGGTKLTIGRMRVDLERLQVDIDGRSANLTPSEFRVLMFLAERPGRPRTRQEILRHLWQTEHVGGERACDAHICNLRRKLERDPARPQVVVTRRGVGYALQVA
jgi:GAF domain-containing protein